jgi:hypothetical protein
MTELSTAQINEIRTKVLGAAAKVPGALIGLGILFIVLGMIGIAGQVLFSFLGIICIPLLLLYILVATEHLGMFAYQAISIVYMGVILFAHFKAYNESGRRMDFADRLESHFRKED